MILFQAAGYLGSIRRNPGCRLRQLRRARGRGLLHHRSERRRQNHDLQPDQPYLQFDLRQADLRGQGVHPHAGLADRRPGHRAHLPEYRAVPECDPAAEPADRPALPFAGWLRFANWCSCPRCARPNSRHREKVEDVIAFLGLQRYRESLIANLPYGVRKVVELGRALCIEPKLLLLDEPSSGLNVEETEGMGFWIEDIKKDLGITVIMVEHDMALVNQVSDRVMALNYGKVLAMGTPREVQTHPEVVRAYLGGEVVSMTEPLLRVNSIETFYGPIQAIRGVSLDVDQGQIVTVLGANGAGKTSVLRTISGVLDPERGQVMFEGRDIARMPPDQVMRLGICHVPEGREIFPFLTVRENLNMGAYTRRDAAGVCERHRTLFRLLPPAEGTRIQRAGLLSGGEQQMLAISRALMGRPKLLLLDEPSLGLSPLLVQQIFGIIRRINHEQNVSILLVEQNAHIALQTADFGYVLEVGRIVAADDCYGADAAGRYQGVLSGPERNRCTRHAALEEETVVELTMSQSTHLHSRRFYRNAPHPTAAKRSCASRTAASGRPSPGRNSTTRSARSGRHCCRRILRVAMWWRSCRKRGRRRSTPTWRSWVAAPPVSRSILTTSRIACAICCRPAEPAGFRGE